MENINTEGVTKSADLDLELKKLEAELLLSASKPSAFDGFWEFLSMRFYTISGRSGLISADPIGNAEKRRKFFSNPKSWQAIVWLIVALLVFSFLLKAIVYSGLNFNAK